MGYISGGNKSTVIGILGTFVCEGSGGLRVHISISVDSERAESSRGLMCRLEGR